MNRRTTQNRLKPPPASPRAGVARTRWNVRAWRTHHRDCCADSLRRLAQRPLATLLTLAVLALALTLPLLLWLLLDNARALGGSIEDARAVSVFLKPDLDAVAVQAMAEQLRGRSDVARVEVKTPEQGLEEFRSRSGFADALKLLHDNPLPAVLVVTPSVTPVDGTPALVAEIERDPAVDLVQHDAQWRQRLNAILRVVTRGVTVLALLLGLAALLVIGNTVRLDIQARLEEIAVMQLLGASDRFVRRPFLYTGFWYGLLAGLLTLATLGVVAVALAAPLSTLLANYDHRFDLHGLSLAGTLLVLGGSTALGWLGAWLAASRHIALGQPT